MIRLFNHVIRGLIVSFREIGLIFCLMICLAPAVTSAAEPDLEEIRAERKRAWEERLEERKAQREIRAEKYRELKEEREELGFGSDEDPLSGIEDDDKDLFSDEGGEEEDDAHAEHGGAQD